MLVAVAVETTVKAMETQESLYATSTAVAQDNAVEATVKAKEIQEAVDATFETKQAGGTPTAASGSAPPVVTTDTYIHGFSFDTDSDRGYHSYSRGYSHSGSYAHSSSNNCSCHYDPDPCSDFHRHSCADNGSYTCSYIDSCTQPGADTNQLPDYRGQHTDWYKRH